MLFRDVLTVLGCIMWYRAVWTGIGLHRYRYVIYICMLSGPKVLII